jgi:hypothetical protein
MSTFPVDWQRLTVRRQPSLKRVWRRQRMRD